MRKVLGTLGVAAVVAVLGCSGGDTTAPSGKLSSPTPPSEASGKPATSGQDGKATSGAAGVINPDNTKIEFVGSAPDRADHRHDGGFKKFSGSVKPIDGDVTKATITLDIDTNSIWTDDDQKMKKLTGHLNSPDFFDTAKYPKATFVSKEIKAEKKDDNTHVITGELTLHGVTKPVTIPAKVTTTDDSVTIDGKFTIDRKEFDFSPNYLAPKVNNEVPVKVVAKVSRK